MQYLILMNNLLFQQSSKVFLSFCLANLFALSVLKWHKRRHPSLHEACQKVLQVDMAPSLLVFTVSLTMGKFGVTMLVLSCILMFIQTGLIWAFMNGHHKVTVVLRILLVLSTLAGCMFMLTGEGLQWRKE